MSAPGTPPPPADGPPPLPSTPPPAGPPPVPPTPGSPAPAAAPAPDASGPATLTATCPTCGSQATYAPGTTVLRCGACGTEREIEAGPAQIREHSYDDWRARNKGAQVAAVGAQELRCQGCGATTESTDLSSTCQFCGGALVAQQQQPGVVAPEAVLPFHVDSAAARTAFKKWVGSRRFAPGALKKVGGTDGLQGTYVPHWTFDAHTETDYRGKRGDHYYVTVSHQVSDGKGGSRTETRQERRTRWRPASGHVRRSFDDLLVVASHRLDPDKLEKMGPWTLAEARPHRPEYLTGFSALRYDVDPQDGAKQARAMMRQQVEDDCEADIGGDEQRVSDMDVTYSRATFKLMLMPLWIATYLYGGKSWQVLVNANTGEVVGDRPWSVAKIAAAVAVVALLVAAIVWLVVSNQQPSGAGGGSGSGPSTVP